jgi:exosortase/archaeosortase family protein
MGTKPYFCRKQQIMLKQNIQKFRRFYDGPFGFVVDVGLFAVITYAFHLLFRYYAGEIMSIPFVRDSGWWLADRVYDISLWFNRNILGYHITTEPVNTMWFSNGGYIAVNTSCSGLKQFYQVFVLFLLFPGPWKHKLWFIPMGFVVMFVTNVFRIISLSVILLWQPDHWDFSHDWILRPFFYVVLFLLWVWWVEQFARKKSAKKNIQKIHH